MQYIEQAESANDEWKKKANEERETGEERRGKKPKST